MEKREHLGEKAMVDVRNKNGIYTSHLSLFMGAVTVNDICDIGAAGSGDPQPLLLYVMWLHTGEQGS